MQTKRKWQRRPLHKSRRSVDRPYIAGGQIKNCARTAQALERWSREPLTGTGFSLDLLAFNAVPFNLQGDGAPRFPWYNMTIRKTVTLFVSCFSAITSNAIAGDGPFFAAEPTMDEAWKAACWDEATLNIVANDCVKGRLAKSGQYSRWSPEFLAEVEQRLPTILANMKNVRTVAAARKNIAYRALTARGVSSADAVILCEDPKIVDALVNGVAGVQLGPDIIIRQEQR